MAATHCWQALTGGNLEGVARTNDARCTDYRFFALREAKDACTRNKACGGAQQAWMGREQGGCDDRV